MSKYSYCPDCGEPIYLARHPYSKLDLVRFNPDHTVHYSKCVQKTGRHKDTPLGTMVRDKFLANPIPKSGMLE